MTIDKFLKKHKILSNFQYGFLKGRGTKDSIAHITKLIFDSYENSEPRAAVFLDLAKAFDTVDHELLFVKLESIGIRGLVLKLLKSYLLNRKQVVKINEYRSDWLTVNLGVPQGSIRYD